MSVLFCVWTLSCIRFKKLKENYFNLGTKLISGVRLAQLICIHVLDLACNLMYALLRLQRAGVRLNLAYIQYSSGTRSWIFDACTHHPAYHIHRNKKQNCHCLQTVVSALLLWPGRKAAFPGGGIKTDLNVKLV